MLNNCGNLKCTATNNHQSPLRSNPKQTRRSFGNIDSATRSVARILLGLGKTTTEFQH